MVGWVGLGWVESLRRGGGRKEEEEEEQMLWWEQVLGWWRWRWRRSGRRERP